MNRKVMWDSDIRHGAMKEGPQCGMEIGGG